MTSAAGADGTGSGAVDAGGAVTSPVEKGAGVGKGSLEATGGWGVPQNGQNRT